MKITVNTAVYSELQMSNKPHSFPHLLRCGLVCVTCPLCPCRSFLFITYVNMFFDDAGKGAGFELWLIFSCAARP